MRNRLQLDRQQYVFILAVAAVSALFVAQAAVDLANVRPVGSDESMIVSVAGDLALDGTLSFRIIDEPRLFTNPPGHFLAVAAVFKVFGPGIAQARWVSVLSALVVVGVVAGLAWRWYGWRVAGVTVVLLFLWRSNATGMDYGLPLLAAARSARYDMSTVAAMWLAVAGIEAYASRPSRWLAFVIGLLAGMAALSHFYGVFLLSVLGTWWLLRTRRPHPEGRGRFWLLGGFLLLVLPYALYVRAHLPEAVAQFTRIHGSRMGFASPLVALDNVVREPLRYLAALSADGIGNWVYVCTLPLALGYVVYRARTGYRRADLLLVSVLFGAGLPLALIDTTKAPIYSLPLLPVFYIAWALTVVEILRWSWPRRSVGAATAKRLILLMAAAIVAEGAAACAYDLFRARMVSPYAQVGRRLEAALPDSGQVAGSPRWAWALHPRDYISLDVLLARAEGESDPPAAVPPFEFVARSAAVSAFIVSRDALGDLARRSEATQREFGAFLSACTSVNGRIEDPTYGVIVVHGIDPGRCDR